MPEQPTESETVQHMEEKPKRPWYIRTLELVILLGWKFWLIVGVLVCFAIAIVVMLLDVSVPREVKLSALAAFVTAPYARWLGRKAKELLWNPGWVYGVELAAEDDKKGSIWRWPATGFGENEVRKGSLDWVNPLLFFAREIDDVDGPGVELEGTWRGTLSDQELMWSLGKVAECRGALVEDAARGFVVETSMWVATFRAAREAVTELRDMMEDGTLPDHGEGLDRAIAVSIEDVGLNDLVQDTRDDLDLPDAWDAEEGAFSDPLGAHDYSDEAKDAVNNGEVDLSGVDLPQREGFVDD